MTPTERRAIMDLASAVCDGNATDDQVAQLDEILRESEEARELYLQTMDLHFDLDRLGARGDFQETSDESHQSVTIPLPIDDAETSSPPIRFRKLRRFTAAAAMIIVVLAVGIWHNNRSIASLRQFDGQVEALDWCWSVRPKSDALARSKSVSI